MQLNIVYTKDSIGIYEADTCTNLPGYGLPFFFLFHTTK